MKLLVQEMCARKGVSRTELARRLGVSYNSLSSACGRNPTLATICRIAQALGCSPAELLPECPPVPAEKGEVRCPRCGALLSLTARDAGED